MLPEGNDHLSELAPAMFLIPMAVLVAKGMVGRPDRKSSLKLYPHRAIKLTGADPVHWTQRWMVDLKTHEKALADYHRLLGTSAV